MNPKIAKDLATGIGRVIDDTRVAVRQAEVLSVDTSAGVKVGIDVDGVQVDDVPCFNNVVPSVGDSAWVMTLRSGRWVIIGHTNGQPVSGGGGGGASVTVSDTEPASPSTGDLWFESDTGRTFVYYNDGSSAQWVEIGGNFGTFTGSGGTPSGIDGSIQFSSSGAFASDASNFYWDDTNNRLGIGTNSPIDPLHVVGDVTIEVSDDGALAQPEVTLHRESASPADGDYLGQIKFAGKNDAGQTVNYAKITGKISDVTDTTEDGLIEIANIKAGSQSIGYRITSTDLKLINGRGLQVDGSVGIGTTSPQNDLHIQDGSSGATADTGTYTQFVVEDSTNAGIHLISPDTGVGRVMMGTPSRQFGSLMRWDYPNLTYDIGTDEASGEIALRTGNFAERVRIDSSGKVGINDTTPSYTLDVNGDINTTGALRTDGKKTGLVLLTSGDVSSGGPITFTNLFSSEFDNYVVYISDLTCTSQSGIYYRTASAGSWNTSSVYSNQRLYIQTTTIGAQRSTGSTYAMLGYSGANKSNFEIHFFSPYLSVQTAVMSREAYSDNTNSSFIEFHHSYVNNTTSYDGFVFDEVSGSASISCRYEVYGIPK